MRVSVREAKVVTERLLMLTGLHLGLVPGVRDFLLAAETVGAGAFRFLRDELSTVTDIGVPRLHLARERPGLLEVDGGNHYAPFIGPLLLNLVVLRVRQLGTAGVLIRNVRRPDLLQGLVPLANRRGLLCTVIVPGDNARVVAMGWGLTTQPVLVGQLPIPIADYGTASARINSGGDPLQTQLAIALAIATGQPSRPQGTDAETGISVELRRALRDGFEVESVLWWDLYHRSNKALTPTSEISRTHTGRIPPEVRDSVGLVVKEQEWDW